MTCKKCGTIRVQEDGYRTLENDDEEGDICADCEQWVEEYI